MTKTLTLLGSGDMGTALGKAWLAAGYDLTVWNRTAARTARLAEAGATVAGTAAKAVAANDLIVLCLLDDASVGEALDGIDLAGKDVVNLTTGTPADARARSAWVAERGGRLLDGGIMAVPPMIGVEGSGAYVFYSGSPELFETRADLLSVPAGTRYVGADAGFAALYDVALLSGMTGMFAGINHAFALLRGENASPAEFATMLAEWLTAMTGMIGGIAESLSKNDFTTGVTSNLAMMVTGNGTLLRTAAEQGVSAELIAPFTDLMARHSAAGHGDEGLAGLVDALRG